jgi:hypothetical protein
MPTSWCWTVTCPGCGCTFTRRATKRERPDPPRVGEPIYGADLERVAICMPCKLDSNKSVTVKRRACLCGCGKIARSRIGFARGHGPTKTYRQSAVGRLHRLRAEAALGKPLPEGAEVHHADGSRSDSAPLVICQDHAYHSLLHARMKIIKMGGNPDTDRFCGACKTIKAASLFYLRRNGSANICRPCRRDEDRRHKDKRRLECRVVRQP